LTYFKRTRGDGKRPVLYGFLEHRQNLEQQANGWHVAGGFRANSRLNPFRLQSSWAQEGSVRLVSGEPEELRVSAFVIHMTIMSIQK
jgi:hypothetical protein